MTIQQTLSNQYAVKIQEQIFKLCHQIELKQQFNKIGPKVFANHYRIRAGIDATGLQPTRASSYYARVLKKDRKKTRKIRKRIKLSTVTDLDHQRPISFKVRRGPASDHLDSIFLVRFAHQVKKIINLDAYKGCTKEQLHRFVVKKCLAEDRISVKNPEVPVWRTRGECLKKAKRKNGFRANGGSLCETHPNVLKRATGSTVRTVKVSMQNKEVAFKVLACSALRRAISSFIQRTFLLSLFPGGCIPRTKGLT